MPFMDSQLPQTTEAAWAHVLASSDTVTRGWLRDTRPLTLHESTFILAVGSDMVRDRIEKNMRPGIETALAEYFTRPISLAISVDSQLAVELDEPDSFIPQPATAQLKIGKQNSDDARLNPKYTFDNFVPGESNRFAHAAAIAVAERPGNAYNPLMIYGESGLGKTHLLHAIGHYVSEYFPELRMRYVSTEELTNDFINAISETRMAEFRHKYRDDIDVLLIDDIQFLEAKLQTQEEFFHTFNALHTAQKQIVLTSDRPPRYLEALEPRLRSRFEWGLMTDIQPPSLETRIAILRKKALAENLTTQPEVLELIASRISTNIRELEGALIRVTAYANLNGQHVDLSLSEEVLRDLLPDRANLQITPELIMDEVANYYSVTVEEIKSPSRTHMLVTARQIAMYLCRDLTELSTPKIGQLFGGRDHTTVMHAVNKVSRMLSERRSVFDQVTEITNRIKQAAVR